MSRARGHCLHGEAAGRSVAACHQSRSRKRSGELVQGYGMQAHGSGGTAARGEIVGGAFGWRKEQDLGRSGLQKIRDPWKEIRVRAAADWLRTGHRGVKSSVTWNVSRSRSRIN